MLAAGAAVAAGTSRVFFAPAAAAETGMLRRPIPHGRETLPVIGIGTSQVFNVGDDAAKRRNLAAVVAAMVEGGGAVVDTASSYDSAEEVVGAIATGTPLRSKVFIATKLEERGGRAAEVEFKTSLERLQVKAVDLLQMHNVTDGDPGLAFFRHLQAEGLTRYVGATTTDSGDYAAMEALIRKDKPDFIEIDCSIGNRAAEARHHPGGGGRRGRRAHRAAVRALVAVRKVKGKPLPDVAKEIGAATWGQVFLKYLLGNPAITAVIPGTGKADHLADNLAAGRGPMPDARQRQALVDLFRGARASASGAAGSRGGPAPAPSPAPPAASAAGRATGCRAARAPRAARR